MPTRRYGPGTLLARADNATGESKKELLRKVACHYNIRSAEDVQLLTEENLKKIGDAFCTSGAKVRRRTIKEDGEDVEILVTNRRQLNASQRNKTYTLMRHFAMLHGYNTSAKNAHSNPLPALGSEKEKTSIILKALSSYRRTVKRFNSGESPEPSEWDDIRSSDDVDIKSWPVNWNKPTFTEVINKFNNMDTWKARGVLLWSSIKAQAENLQKQSKYKPRDAPRQIISKGDMAKLRKIRRKNEVLRNRKDLTPDSKKSYDAIFYKDEYVKERKSKARSTSSHPRRSESYRLRRKECIDLATDLLKLHGFRLNNKDEVVEIRDKCMVWKNLVFKHAGAKDVSTEDTPIGDIPKRLSSERCRNSACKLLQSSWKPESATSTTKQLRIHIKNRVDEIDLENCKKNHPRKKITKTKEQQEQAKQRRAKSREANKRKSKALAERRKFVKLAIGHLYGVNGYTIKNGRAHKIPQASLHDRICSHMKELKAMVKTQQFRKWDDMILIDDFTPIHNTPKVLSFIEKGWKLSLIWRQAASRYTAAAKEWLENNEAKYSDICSSLQKRKTSIDNTVNKRIGQLKKTLKNAIKKEDFLEAANIKNEMNRVLDLGALLASPKNKVKEKKSPKGASKKKLPTS